ncbi:MAG: LysR family transcriptional regulator [Eubacterium sp.]|nr:LysR family transcriptional regulator [Eubacterium sp.]
MNQNLPFYKIFCTVAETGNISKAAKELYISQPAISKSIQKLEENIGTRLFSRSSRGVTLTEEGEMLYEHVKSAFETLSLGENKVKKSIELGIGHLRIGVSSTLCKYVLLPYLKEFIRQYPHVHISVFCQPTNQTLKLLADDRIDIGMVGEPKAAKNIVFYSLQEIEDTFVATRDYLKNLKVRGVSKSHLLEYSTLMLLDKGNMSRQHMEKYFQENNIEAEDYIEISSMDLLIDFAKIGVGIACVIREFVEKDIRNGTLVEIPFSPKPDKRKIGFAYSNNRKSSKTLCQFIHFYENYRPEL